MNVIYRAILHINVSFDYEQRYGNESEFRVDYFDKLFKNRYVAQDIYFLSIEIIDKK